MNKEYILPDAGSAGMASEPAVAHKAKSGHVSMSFDVPDSLDAESFRFLMMVYARQLVEQEKGRKHRRTLTDEELAEQLQSLPCFADGQDATSCLTKDDYSRFMRVRKPMKGIAKWL